MSKKPAAVLSANLVAVKGMATPAPDMPGRVVPPVSTSTAPMASSPGTPTPTAQSDAGGQPLNFRVSDAFRRDFKVYAAQHDLKLNELLRLCFEAYRNQNGE